MKISIITPSYNAENYIEDAIKSVLDQNYENCEHIIVDGGSKDGTIGIIKKYPHLIWISEKDSGQSDALNKAIQMTSGNIIGTLNADDYYKPGTFRKIADYFSNGEDLFLYGKCEIINHEGMKYLNDPNISTILELIYSFKKYGLHKNLFPFNPSAYFYTKSIHEKVGMYNENDHLTMDLDFILRVMKNKIKLQKVNDVLGVFIQHKGTKTFTEVINERSNENILNLLMQHYSELDYKLFCCKRNIREVVLRNYRSVKKIFR